MAPERMGGLNARKELPGKTAQAAHPDVHSPRTNEKPTATFEGRKCTDVTD